MTSICFPGELFLFDGNNRLSIFEGALNVNWIEHERRID